MTVQAGLCRTCSETTLLVFPLGGLNMSNALSLSLIKMTKIKKTGSMANGYGEGIPSNTYLETLRVPKQCIRATTSENQQSAVTAQLISPFFFTTQYNFCTS